MVESPVIGVGVLVVKDTQVLLVRRASPPRQGCWAVPGGKLNLGETLQQAAEREVLEETGLTVKAGQPVHVFELMEKDGPRWRFHYVVVDLVASYISGELRAGSDAAEVKWFPARELSDPEIDPETLILISKGLGKITEFVL